MAEQTEQTTLTGIPYVKWTNSAEEILHVGILTATSDTHCTILTKRGEMTIPLDDGEVVDATREEFEAVELPAEPTHTATFTLKEGVTPRPGSKLEQAHAILTDAIANGLTKQEVIAKLEADLSVSKNNAGIYFYKLVN